MNTYIALFRGINVGGNNIIRMKQLSSLLEGMGFQDVTTYIQSGNVVFRYHNKNIADLSDRVRTAIKKEHGFEPHVLLLELEEMENAIQSNPFREADANPKSLHLFFLCAPAMNPKLGDLEKLKKESEQFALRGDVFYLYAPDGIGRSKLAAKTEKMLGVSVTSRNWRTVNKITALAREIA